MKSRVALPVGAATVLLPAILGLTFAQTRTPPDELVFERQGNQWFEGLTTPVRISADGRLALFGPRGDIHLFSLAAGREEAGTLKGSLDSINSAAFCGAGAAALIRNGSHGPENGWFTPAGETGPLSTVPARAAPVCSPDGSEIAYYDASVPDRGLFVGRFGEYRNYSISAAPTGIGFSPGGEMLYYMTLHANGETSLSRIEVGTGKSQTIASRLDASRMGQIAVSPDGKHGYVALASDGVPDNEARHKPDTDRWLKIYEIDLATGARRRIVDSPCQDNTGPAIANGNLYWTRRVMRDSIVTVPLAGGEAKEVIAGGELPMWNPDGSRIGYFFGGKRLADWFLNQDDAVVSVDVDGNRTSGPEVIVSGYHEDFTPAWSPDGKWIAFHSHRSPTPVPDYASPGGTDDVYLRRASDVNAPEIRLTNFGWETWPAYWSPDGKKLLFSSWQRGGEPGIGKLWALTIDTDTGSSLKAEMLPLPAEIRSAQWGMWSPDGKEIAIDDNRGAGKRTIWIVRADGSHPEKLLDYASTTYGGLDWARDGRAIIYSGLAGDRLQLFSELRSGGAPRQLTHDSGNLMHPRVSPDGRRIACTRIVQSNQIWRRPVS
jgi:Tol biopolymer transport system component